MARWNKNDILTLAAVEIKFGSPVPGNCDDCPCLKACSEIVNTAALLACELDDDSAGVAYIESCQDSWLSEVGATLRHEPPADDWHGDWTGAHPYPTLRAYLDTSQMMGAAKIDT